MVNTESRLDFLTCNTLGYVSITSLTSWLRKEALENPHTAPVKDVLVEEAALIEKAYKDAAK